MKTGSAPSAVQRGALARVGKLYKAPASIEAGSGQMEGITLWIYIVGGNLPAHGAINAYSKKEGCSLVNFSLNSIQRLSFDIAACRTYGRKTRQAAGEAVAFLTIWKQKNGQKYTQRSPLERARIVHGFYQRARLNPASG